MDLLIPKSQAGAEASDRGDGPGKLQELIPDAHRRFVDDLLHRHEVPALRPDRIETEIRTDVTTKAADDVLHVALAHSQIRLVANALGPAPPSLVAAAHQHGVLVASLVGSVKHAQSQVEAGADIIVAQGGEAGGHTGEISTMVLVPQVVDEVSPLPVLAAGGVGNGRQIAAALALGAQGVWCGSVWLTTEKAETHPVVKRKMLAATSSDTVRSRSSTGKPARQLRTPWTEAWDDPRNPDPLPLPLHWTLIRDAQVRLAKHAEINSGAAEMITYFVGQVIGQSTGSSPPNRWWSRWSRSSSTPSTA